MSETLGFILVGVGLAFDLFGCIGLIRMPDLYLRLQTATKCVTLGTCSILFGTFLVVGPAGGLKALLCMLFIVLTNPVAAHAIARSAHRAGIPLWKGTVKDDYEEDHPRK